jgi:hypothetical protein
VYPDGGFQLHTRVGASLRSSPMSS